MRELDVLDELSDIGPARLAGGIVDEAEGLVLELQYFGQSLDHIVHQLRLLALVCHAYYNIILTHLTNILIELSSSSKKIIVRERPIFTIFPL